MNRDYYKYRHARDKVGKQQIMRQTMSPKMTGMMHAHEQEFVRSVSHNRRIL